MWRHRKKSSCKHDKCMCGYPQPRPPQQLPTQTLPAQYDPVKENTEFVGRDVIIPVVHPTHTTQINHTTYKYMHSYPHTRSIVNSVSHEHYCVCPPNHYCHGPKPGNWFW